MATAGNKERVVRFIASASHSAIEALLELVLNRHNGLLLSVSTAVVLVDQHCIFRSLLEQLRLSVSVAVRMKRGG